MSDFLRADLARKKKEIACKKTIINKLKTQLKEAEKVIDLLYTKEESTTLKSRCWINAMEYKTKYE